MSRARLRDLGITIGLLPTGLIDRSAHSRSRRFIVLRDTIHGYNCTVFHRIII